MVLPLLFGLAGSALGGAGLAGGLGALTAGAIGSGLGRFAETGDLGKGIETGLTSFLGGKALGALGSGLGIKSLANPEVADASRQAVSTAIGQSPSVTQQLMTTATDPSRLGQALIGQASAVSPPELPPVAPVDFENRQAGVPDRITRRPPPDYRPGYDGEFDYGVSPNFGIGLMNPNDPRFMNSGGIMALSNGGELKPIPEDNKGLPNLPKDVRNKMGFMQEGGAVEGDMEANKIIDDAVNAIKGLSDSPEIALGVFVAKYGEEALEDLIQRVNDGEFDQPREDNMIEGEGDGMDDKVPATLEGEQDVMLSDGEFVVPADVVSGIGNGSSDAGARELEDMMTRVRKLRTGKTEQPEQVPQEMMLPA